MSMPTFPTEGLNNVPLKDLVWLIGNWRLHKESEVLDEQWMDSQENMMLGMFRWMKNGATLVTELMQIHQVDSKTLLQLRHFDKTFTPWEEKDKPLKYLLVQLNSPKAVFKRIDHKEQKGWFAYELIESHTLRFTDYDKEGTIHLEINFLRNG